MPAATKPSNTTGFPTLVGDLSCQSRAAQTDSNRLPAHPSIPSAPKSDARNLHHTFFLLLQSNHHQARPPAPSTTLLQGSAAVSCPACARVKAAWVLLTPRPAARLDTQSYRPCETTRPREELAGPLSAQEQTRMRHGHERFLHKPHKAVELRAPGHSHPPAICITLPLRIPIHIPPRSANPQSGPPGLARSAQHLGLRCLLFASAASYNICEGLLPSSKPTD